MLKKYFATKLVVIGSIILIFLIGVIFWLTGSGNNPDLIKVVRTTIVQSIVITGKTEAAENTEMSFDRAGRVSSVSVKVGDRVTAGQILASLDSADLYAELDQALARVKSQEAKLMEIKKGATLGGGSLANSEVVGAQNDLRNSLENLSRSLVDAYTKNDDAVRNLTDIFFDYPRTPNAYYNLDGVTSDELIELSFFRRDLEERLVVWNNHIDSLSANSDLGKEYNLGLENLLKTRIYLDKISLAVNKITPYGSISDTTLSGYRANVSTARSEVNVAISDLQSAKQAVTSAKNKLDLVISTPEELLVGEADVEQAEAQAAQIRAQIAKNMIIAPISGVVTRQDVKVGETSAPGTNVITVMSFGEFEISANVPEVDVGKLVVGNKVVITLDAYPGEVWAGRVSYIEPAETIVDGVVNYKIKVGFDNKDDRLKSGLTANLNIETVRKENVLVLPQYAIIENNKGTFVKKNLDNNNPEEVEIKIGVRSQDGNVEIISGVNEGDDILTTGLNK